MFVDNIARSFDVWMKKRVLAELPQLIMDFIAIAAVASISYGAWLAWRPAGFIVGGAIVLVFEWFYVRGGRSPTGVN
jgi:hypothetical protein